MLNFALIGSGKWGNNYYELLRRLRGASLKTVVTLDSGNLHAVLRDSSIQCVVIATPPRTHFRLAAAAVKAGKHVLLEKPMVLSVKDAQALARLVKKHRVTFMVGHQYLYNEDILHLKKFIDSGRLGKISYMLMDHSSSAGRTDVGILWDTAPHALSIFQFLFRPKKIANFCVKHSADKKFVAADVQFDRGPLFCMRAGWYGPEKVRKITVVGERRSAILDETMKNGKLKLFNPVRVQPSRSRTPLENEIEHFITCVRSRRKPLTNVEHGARIVEWIDKLS